MAQAGTAVFQLSCIGIVLKDSVSLSEVDWVFFRCSFIPFYRLTFNYHNETLYFAISNFNDFQCKNIHFYSSACLGVLIMHTSHSQSYLQSLFLMWDCL